MPLRYSVAKARAFWFTALQILRIDETGVDGLVRSMAKSTRAFFSKLGLSSLTISIFSRWEMRLPMSEVILSSRFLRCSAYMRNLMMLEITAEYGVR